MRLHALTCTKIRSKLSRFKNYKETETETYSGLQDCAWSLLLPSQCFCAASVAFSETGKTPHHVMPSCLHVPITISTHLCQVMWEHGTLLRSCRQVARDFISSKNLLRIGVHCQDQYRLFFRMLPLFHSVPCLWVHTRLVLYTIVHPLKTINYELKNFATVSVPHSKRSSPPRLNSHVHIIMFMHTPMIFIIFPQIFC